MRYSCKMFIDKIYTGTIFLILTSLMYFSCSGNKKKNSSEVFFTCDSVMKIDETFHNNKTVSSDLYELCSSNISKFKKYKEDENGIYLVEIEGQLVYFPITISQAAVTFYKNYKETGNQDALKKFEVLSSWLKDNFIISENYGFWYCETKHDAYELQEHWPSAMAQGFGIMAMYEAFVLTKDSVYLNIVEKALNGYDVSVEKGGFTRFFNNGRWYEEYPSPDPSQVLNGFIFSLGGLYDYYEATGSLKAEKLFEEGFKLLEEELCYYNLFFSSRYNLYKRNPQLACAIGSGSGDGYHHLHIEQLTWLYSKTGKGFLLNYAQSFLNKDRYDFIPSYRLEKKIKSIEASNCIECQDFGANNLFDGIWSYGSYWSSNKNSELIIDLGFEQKGIYSILLFFTNEEASEISLSIHARKQKSEDWEFKSSTNLGDVSNVYHFQTGNYQTYIYGVDVVPFNSRYVKLELEKNESFDYAIREIDVLYDRTQDLKKIFERK